MPVPSSGSTRARIAARFAGQNANTVALIILCFPFHLPHVKSRRETYHMLSGWDFQISQPKIRKLQLKAVANCRSTPICHAAWTIPYPLGKSFFAQSPSLSSSLMYREFELSRVCRNEDVNCLTNFDVVRSRTTDWARCCRD